MTSAAPSAGRPEIPGLTGLRAFAALWVVAHHNRVFVEGRLGEPWMGILDRGYLGVDLFFTLSGFVLAYNYGGRIVDATSYGRFIALRLARLYPLHLATLAVVVGLVATANLTGLHLLSPKLHAFDHHLLLHLLMIHAWGFETGLRYNQVSWSISAEFFAYLLFPLAWAITVRFRRPAVTAIAALLSAGATVLALRALGHPSLHVPTQHALVRVSGEFLAGALAFRLWDRLGRARLPAGASDAALLGLVALALVPAADPWLAVAAPGLVLVLAAATGRAIHAFTNPVALYLGRISYSIYLTHMMVLAGLHRVLPSFQLGTLGLARDLGVLAAHAAAILAVASASYHFFEWPARQALRARLGRSRETPSRSR